MTPPRRCNHKALALRGGARGSLPDPAAAARAAGTGRRARMDGVASPAGRVQSPRRRGQPGFWRPDRRRALSSGCAAAAFRADWAGCRDRAVLRHQAPSGIARGPGLAERATRRAGAAAAPLPRPRRLECPAGDAAAEILPVAVALWFTGTRWGAAGFCGDRLYGGRGRGAPRWGGGPGQGAGLAVTRAGGCRGPTVSCYQARRQSPWWGDRQRC